MNQCCKRRTPRSNRYPQIPKRVLACRVRWAYNSAYAAERRQQSEMREERGKMLKGFRDFILRGNVVDLAVAFIMGAAFNAIVSSLVKDVMMQFIAAAGGKPDFSL